ncbi:HTTM domain-containing protein [Aureisphaera galaxeae]|uniref:HTTM domain-containing protein n=1 Tax=Aureisphaera galaxeae TaxID=1538023 RepID=UPI0023500516|nr:HTTM domain-containing protein [Aureisphaera galaxeae]MDC8005970.1 HTTM domain-containing protein [Aureisphaera galaxeae]
MNKLLFSRIDNTGLVLWRIAFGLLIALEGFGAIATGWVRRVFVEPEFTFHFIGFDFLQPLPGGGMYIYFAVLGILGVCVMIGYRYRFAMFAYALMWTCVYLMQKTSYNNHYYLMMLLCWIMVLLPANRWLSLDVKRNPALRSLSMPRWVKVILILQVFIVFTYASIAKMYPDWFNLKAPALLMLGKKEYWLIGDLLQQTWVHYSIAYFGLLFDLLIIPMFLWKRTRFLAFSLSLFFHLFNSVVFQIGIFPYMSIAFAFFFFSSETLIKRFKLKREVYTGDEIITPSYAKPAIVAFSIYFLVQIGLPVRHWFFPEDVLWTEEGHRLSWRMMLRSRSGALTIWVEDKETGKRTKYPYREMLSKKQRRNVQTKPDLIWQLAQRIHAIEKEKGKDVAVYANCRVKINGGVYHPFIDSEVDLAQEKWYPLQHHDWILPTPADYHSKAEKE